MTTEAVIVMGLHGKYNDGYGIVWSLPKKVQVPPAPMTMDGLWDLTSNLGTHDYFDGNGRRWNNGAPQNNYIGNLVATIDDPVYPTELNPVPAAIPSDPIYPHSRYNELLKEIFLEVRHLGVIKGGEYAGDDDRLANFRRNGRDTGLPMEAIWRVYAGKHWDAVTQYVKDTITGKVRIRSESIKGRVVDLIVYLILFVAMVEEREKGKMNETTGPVT